MKKNGPGLLLVSLLVIAAAAVGVWLRSSPDTSQGATPVAEDGPPSVGAVTQGAPARVEVPVGDASDAVRTEVDIGSAGDAAPTDIVTPAYVHRVRGRVVDARGVGIEGARVGIADRDLERLPLGIIGLGELRASTNGGVSTDSDGEFELTLKEAGKFCLVATHPEHPRGEHRGVAASDIEDIVIRLRDGAAIKGRVIGAPDNVKSIIVFSKRTEGAIGAATSGAFFNLGGIVDAVGAPTGRSATVDEERKFYLRGLVPDERYSIWAANADVSNGFPVKRTFALGLRAGTVDAELIWRDPLTVSVRVVAADTNEPLERLDVAAGYVKEVKMFGMAMAVATTRRLAQTEFPSGVVRIDGLEVRDGEGQVFAVEVRADGRKPWIRHDISVSRSGHVDLGVAMLERAAVVVARVVATKAGEPISGAKVELIEIDKGEDGGSGEKGSTSISLLTTVPSPKGAGDSPVDANMASTAAEGMSGTTDENGECRIAAEFEGRAQLRVRAGGYAPSVSGPFDLSSRGEIEIDVAMHRGGTVHVTVIDGHGVPVPLAFVQRKGPVEGDEGKGRTDKDGVLTFAALSVGEHTFKLLDAEVDKNGPLKIDLSGILDQSAGKSVQVSDGEIANVTLEKPLRGTVTGLVMLDGVPLEGATVRLYGAKAAGMELASELLGSLLGGLVDSGVSGETDVDGRFEMERVDAGDYRLVVNHRELVMPSSTAAQVFEGNNWIDVAIVTTTVRGRVVDESGVPVARATLSVMAAYGKISDLVDQMGDAKGMMAELFGGGGSNAGVKTGSDGTFQLRCVRSGVPLIVGAKARLHVAGTQRIESLAAGANREGVEVVLRQAGRVRVFAIGVRGALSVKLKWAGTPSDDAPRDREVLLRRSRVTIDGLLPGTWRVELSGMESSGQPQPRTVEIGAGATERVDFGQ